MANYTVTRACGHEETVALVGKTKDREWRLDHVEQFKLCHECYQIDLQKRREEANREAAEAAQVNNYPALTGTDKQVPWAETIRAELITYMEKIMLNRLYSGDIKGNPQDAIEHIKSSKTTAHWWIDRRYLIKDSFKIINLLNDELDRLKHEEVMPPNEVVKDILAEATVRPESPVTETVAEIRILEDMIEIRFPEKRDSFRELVKSALKMVWSEGSWKRRIRTKNGTVEDRAAEAGNRLLNAGIPIRIFDADLRTKAIKADYKPECTRWIQARTEGDYKEWYVISWSRDEDLYRQAKSITGAKYDKPNIVVPSEHFADVQDFAKMYKFEISEKARSIMDRSKEIRDNSIIATPSKPRERSRAVVRDKPPVLEIPTEVEIADEFKD